MKEKERVKRWLMRLEIKHLKEEGLKISQIALRLGIHRHTVRKYLNMSEEEFERFQDKKREKKLGEYEEFVKEKLKEFPEFTSPQIHDRLLEISPELKVSEKTVYNYVKELREKYGITKPETKREFQRVRELPFGKQIQIDFGEGYGIKNGKKSKVHFLTAVLSRSRKRFVHFEPKRFDAEKAIYAMEKMFEYYGGMTEEIVFDQDGVFISNENGGDLILTKKFERYANERKFKVHFCRARDPQSKGKVENNVRYVKYNFLKGRTFLNIEDLNKQAEGWLERTANQKKNSVTKKIPAEEFQTEIKFLRPITKKIKTNTEIVSYIVRKDNTVIYRGNSYSLPLGTYKNKNTRVEVIENEGVLFIKKDGEVIARHRIPVTRGNFVSNRNHFRDNTKKIGELVKKTSELFQESEKAFEYLEKIRSEKPRYTRDQMKIIQKSIECSEDEIVNKTLNFCMENNIFSANDFKDIMKKFSKETVFEIEFEESNIPVIPVEKRGMEFYSQAVDSNG